MEPAPMMPARKWVLPAVLALIALPGAVALAGAVSFYAANASNRTMVSSGEERDYLLYVPPSYDRTRPTPLVISLHGAGLWGAAQREISQWNREADARGFIVVYPSGARGQGVRVWRAEDGSGLMVDVRFISQLIDTLRREYHIDSTRIYANGLSNGGGMSFVLSCTLWDRIAAVGLVAAAMTLPSRWCGDRRPVPMIWFHGTADPAVPYRGGGSWVTPEQRGFPSVPAFVASWARRNGCEGPPADSLVAADVTRRAYTRCARDATVMLYTVRGGGHTWPGGKSLPEAWLGRTTNSVDATKLMWAFFSQHPLRASPPDAHRPR